MFLLSMLAAGASAGDLCSDAVDPYLPGVERARFFEAAGSDSELVEAEFEADRKRPNGFVRAFDQWKALAAFDKDASGKIDWFEADAYRRELRRRVLAAFDANRDGQLAGKEREAAVKALTEGQVPEAPAATPETPAHGKIVPLAPQPAPAPAAGGDAEMPYHRPDYDALRRKHDPDGDGQLTPEQWQAVAREAQEQQRAWELRRFDADGNGQLDENERRAMQQARTDWAARMTEQHLFRQFDRNGDGQLDAEEQAALDKHKAETARRREEWTRRAAEHRKLYEQIVARNDANGNGRIDEDERAAFLEDYRRAMELRRFDADGDGQLNETERAAAEAERTRVAQRLAELQQRFVQRWDRDGDGKVSDEERQEMYAEMRRQWEERRKEMDADGDGTVSPEEGQQYWQRLRDTYDTNKDGQLDEEERRKMGEELGGAVFRRGGRPNNVRATVTPGGQ